MPFLVHTVPRAWRILTAFLSLSKTEEVRIIHRLDSPGLRFTGPTFFNEDNVQTTPFGGRLNCKLLFHSSLHEFGV